MLVIVCGPAAYLFWKERTSAPAGAPSAASRKTGPAHRHVPPGSHARDPARLLPDAPSTTVQKKAPRFDEAMQRAFEQHPKRPVFTRRMNAIKTGTHEILNLLTSEVKEEMEEWAKQVKASKDATLPEAERAAAKAKMEKLTASIKAGERSLDEFRVKTERWMDAVKIAGQNAILAEINNPPLQPASENSVPDTPAWRDAAARLNASDYAAAEAAYSALAAGASSGQSAEVAQWHALLCRAMAGQETALATSPLMTGSPAAACYALAVQAIQQGGWEEAGIWVQQANAFGDPVENTPYRDTLESLGWMDPETGKLIPPAK